MNKLKSKTLKRKWVAALRSGKYKQGTFTFQCGDTFCCLGVLCAIARRPSGWGFVSSCFKDGGDAVCDKLALMNDTGTSFKKIASYIERYL
jgi:hypothetical protein